MADSDNSTTLPALINRWRRRHASIHSFGARSDAVVEINLGLLPADAAIELFRDWREMHYAATVLCRLQQRSERRIARKGSGDDADSQHLAQQRHEASRLAELAAMDAEDHLLTRLASTPANSLPGVLAKLEMIAGASQGRGVRTEFPWPQIQSTVKDLRNVLAEGQVAVGFA